MIATRTVRAATAEKREAEVDWVKCSVGGSALHAASEARRCRLNLSCHDEQSEREGYSKHNRPKDQTGHFGIKLFCLFQHCRYLPIWSSVIGSQRMKASEGCVECDCFTTAIEPICRGNRQALELGC